MSNHYVPNNRYEKLSAGDSLMVSGEEVLVRNFTVGTRVPDVRESIVATMVIPERLVPTPRFHDMVFDALTELLDRLTVEWEWEQK